MRLRLSQRAKAFWRNSQTKAWGFIQLGSSGVLYGISTVNSWVSDPTFKSYLNDMDVPKSIIVGIAAIGLLTYLFHGHDDA